jgi:uncharacterized protein (DUF697 family)
LAVLAGLLPVPGVDLIVLQRLQIGLIRRLTTLYQRPFSYLQAKKILSLVPSVEGANALVVLQAVGSISKLMPGYGLLAGVSSTAISGGIGTHSLGQLLQQHFARGGHLNNFSLVPQDFTEAQSAAVATIADFDEIKAHVAQTQTSQTPPASANTEHVADSEDRAESADRADSEERAETADRADSDRETPEATVSPVSAAALIPAQAPPLQPQISPSVPTRPDERAAELQLNELRVTSCVQLSPPAASDQLTPINTPSFAQNSVAALLPDPAPATPPPSEPTETTLNRTVEETTPANSSRWSWPLFWITTLLLLSIAGGSWYWFNNQQKSVILSVVEPVAGEHYANINDDGIQWVVIAQSQCVKIS